MRKRITIVAAAALTLLLLTESASACYSPAKGRFLARDPIGEEGGLNLYECLDDDPINKTDLFGLREIKFTVKRSAQGKHASLGTFKTEAEEFEPVTGATLELIAGTYDLKRGEGSKTYPVPAGTYKAVPHTYGGAWALKLTENPKGFTNVLVHVGNFVWDTSGCILVGPNSQVAVKVDIPIRKLTSAQWGALYDQKMIVGEKGKPAGVSDRLGSSSRATLAKMKELYDKVSKKDGKKCTFITVIIEGAPQTQPSTGPATQPGTNPA